MRRLVTILLTLVLSFACTGADEYQFIDIQEFETYEQNAKLAIDLAYYDPRYLIDKIPVLDQGHFAGIKVGYFLPSNGSAPKYRIVYALENPAVLANRNSLVKAFSEFIPRLAKRHASLQPQIVQLQLKAETWFRNIVTGKVAEAWAEASNTLKSRTTEAGLNAFAKDIRSKYGQPKEFDFVRAQAYEAYLDLPENIAIQLFTPFERDHALGTIVNFSKQSDDAEWKVIGFNVHPFNAE